MMKYEMDENSENFEDEHKFSLLDIEALSE